MDRRFVRQPAGGAHPDMKPVAGELLASIAIVLDRPQLDRSLALVVSAHRLRHQRRYPLLKFRFAWQSVRCRHVRHCELMRQIAFLDVKGYRHREDGMAMLNRHDAPRAEATAVADSIDLEDERHFWVSADQEVSVQRMRRSRRHVIDGTAGGHQRLA